MLKWLGRTLKQASETMARLIDPWKGSEGFYVAGFRRHLDKIAKALSQKDRAVYTRFNSELRCAELCVPFGDVLARVAVHGECCAPYEAVITTLSLPEGAKALFTEAFSPLPVEFKKAA